MPRPRGLTCGGGPDLQRTDLSNEAIRLARAVQELLPDDGEVAGLLAPIAAIALYRAAAAKTTSVPERTYLTMRAARLSEAPH